MSPILLNNSKAAIPLFDFIKDPHDEDPSIQEPLEEKEIEGKKVQEKSAMNPPPYAEERNVHKRDRNISIISIVST